MDGLLFGPHYAGLNCYAAHLVVCASGGPYDTIGECGAGVQACEACCMNINR
jgi:hypothetical protein